MARKFLVVLLIAILFIGIAQIPVVTVVTAEIDPKQPDITTEKIIILDPTIAPLLVKGTLSIVSFKSGNIIGFQVGNAYSTNIIAVLDKPLKAQITQPVALVLRNKVLEIYLAPINILSFEWSALSISQSQIPKSYFPLLITAQIVDFKKVGYEKEVNYCCNPPVVKVKYDYKLYLNTDTNPYEPSKGYNVVIYVVVPEENVKDLESAAKNDDYIWIGVSAPHATVDNAPYVNTKIYLWIS